MVKRHHLKTHYQIDNHEYEAGDAKAGHNRIRVQPTGLITLLSVNGVGPRMIRAFFCSARCLKVGLFHGSSLVAVVVDVVGDYA